MNSSENVIVITGGSGGIGQACARALKGNQLIITDYAQDTVNKTVETLTKEGFNVTGIACDITKQNDIDKLINFVAKHGELKALIHTAGVSGTVKDLNKVFTIDLVATELLVEAFYKLATNNSVAVLLASMMAHTVPANEEYDQALRNPLKTNAFETVKKFVHGSSDTMYNFAKRGVKLLVEKHVDKWGAKGARIVSVSPGVIETPMALKAAEEHPERMKMIKQITPLQRNGQPSDIADVINFLVNDGARFITGTDILVDGGVIRNIKKLEQPSV